jgi:hypothetical protein
MLLEAAFPILVWLPRARRPVLLFGVVFHLGIEFFLKIPAFSTAILCMYLLFLSDEEAKTVFAWFRRLVPRPRRAPPVR